MVKLESKKINFGTWGIKLNFFTKEQLHKAITAQKKSAQRLGDICIQQGILTHEQKAEITASHFSLQYVIPPDHIDPDLLNLVSLQFMKEYQVVPYKKENNTLFIAMEEPLPSIAAKLNILTGMVVVIVIASETRIAKIIKQSETDLDLKFGEWGIKLGFLTKGQLSRALSRHGRAKQELGEACVQQGIIDPDQKAEIIAKKFSYQYIKLDKSIDPDILNLLPLSFMKEYQVIPYAKNNDTLFVAMAEPLYFFSVEQILESLTGIDISIAIASGTKIRKILKNIKA